MSVLKEGIKHIIKEALPFPGMVQACDPGDSNVSPSDHLQFNETLKTSILPDQVTHKEAAIRRHVEDLKKSLERPNAIDHTRQVEFKNQLDRLVDDYRRNNAGTGRLSRLTKVAETLEALDNLSEDITMSIQRYTVNSIRDHSEMLKSVDNDLKSAKANVEERMSKNEAQMSSVFDMLKNLKGLLHQAAESLTSLKPLGLPQLPIAWRRHILVHPEGSHFWCAHYGSGTWWPYGWYALVRGRTYSPNDHGCTTPLSFDISSMFSHQTTAIQVIAKCFQSMASSIRVGPDMPIHACSHSCVPMAST
ncbi:hypothetical protein FRC10_000932 [Ceratobasidium sp. 414]|nr:hypothetical protein FRC10_000932 [Ceratobasidium sp. 414]